MLFDKISLYIAHTINRRENRITEIQKKKKKKKKKNPFEITETFIYKVFFKNSSVTQIAKITRKLEEGECISKTLYMIVA